MEAATSALPRIGQLLLIRLLTVGKRSRPNELRRSIEHLLLQPLSGEEWHTLLEELTNAGLVTPKPLLLTHAGRAEALSILGVESLPSCATWNTIRQRYLVPLALGISPRDTHLRNRVAATDGLSAYLLKKQYDLPVETAPTLKRALEGLVCKKLSEKLGLPPQSSLVALRTAVLKSLAPSADQLDLKQLEKLLPAVLLGGRPGKDGIRNDLLARWVQGEIAPAQGLQNLAGPPYTDFDLPTFATAVQATARHCPPDSWFGDNKVFVNRLWRQFQNQPRMPLALPAFKQRLIEANQMGLVRLSRADLVQVMNATDIHESEIRHLNAVFHFVLVEGNPR